MPANIGERVRSRGLFDITSGVLRRVWKFDGSDRLPTPAAVHEALQMVGWGKVGWQAPVFCMPAGMQIDFDESAPLVLDQRLKFLQFSGEWTARGRLLGGAVRDFNVIVRRAAFQAEVLHRPLVGPMVFLPEAKTTWFIYVAGGHAELNDVAGMDLEAGDSLLLERDGEARNRVLSGGGEVVLVKLTRA